jgi:hypothetical protein
MIVDSMTQQAFGRRLRNAATGDLFGVILEEPS